MSTATPWGPSQTTERCGPGIMFYTTAGHGGFHVAPTLQATMPDALRLKAGWYEEDCDWARVVLAFPQYFTSTYQAQAKETLRAWCPKAYEQFYGIKLQPGDSYILDRRRE